MRRYRMRKRGRPRPPSACSAASTCRSTASPRACATPADDSFSREPGGLLSRLQRALAELQSAPASRSIRRCGPFDILIRIDTAVPPLARGRTPAAARGRLQLAASAFVLLAGTGVGAVRWHAATIMQQVFDVEARYGNDPERRSSSTCAPLEVPARASGGDDLRAFLAAWGYAHAVPPTSPPWPTPRSRSSPTSANARTTPRRSRRPIRVEGVGCCPSPGRSARRSAGSRRRCPTRARTRQPRPALLGRDERRRPGDEQRPDGRGHPPVRGCGEAPGREVNNPRREAQAYQSLVPMRIVKGEFAHGAARGGSWCGKLGARSTDDGLVVVGWMWESLAAARPMARLAARGARPASRRSRPRSARSRSQARHHRSTAPARTSSQTMNSQAGQTCPGSAASRTG